MCYYYIIWFEKYRVIQILANHENRTVYLTEHIRLKCYRIIKQIKKTPELTQSFKNEVTSLKNLKHPNIPIIYDIEEDLDYYYMIEEYIEGESLKAYRQKSGFIKEDKILDFIIQLCDVIDTLHSNKESILYLDLKPSNIIICQDVVKLIDFGTAIFEKEVEFRNVSFGTKGYASPEQYGLGHIDKRSDIYGIGTVLFFLMTGCSFVNEKESFPMIRNKKAYSFRLKKIVYRCLCFTPSKRFSSVNILESQLERLKFKSRLSITPYFSTLFCSLEKKEKKDSQKKLALVGMKHGVGTTHIGMLLANYFGQEKSVKTAYVEWNKTGAFSKLCESIYGYKKEVFCIQNVDYFAYQSEKELEQAVLEKYDYIIFDFGVELKNNKEKMRGCEETLFIGNLERWNKKDYVDFQKQYDEYCGNLGKFVCNFGREDMIRQVEKTIHKKINFIGYQPINQPLKGEIEQFFYSLK